VQEEPRRVVKATTPSWDGADWAALVESGVRRSYIAGQHILRQGDEGNWVAALVSGRAKILYAGSAGEEILLAVRGPGDLLGEFAQGDREPRSASVQTLERSIVSLVADVRFKDWVNKRHLRAKLDHYMLAKARESADLAWRLTRFRPAQRLASLLLAVVAAGGDRHPNPETVPMSQDELARAIGLARSSITPILADWKKRGVVAIDRSHMTISDVGALQRLQQTDSGAT
jgi:CRP-like cAMP-binding protein